MQQNVMRFVGYIAVVFLKNDITVEADGIAFALVLEIVSIVKLIVDNAGFILLMEHLCLFSTIEMMQAVANITNNRIQNDIKMPRRSSRHHGSSIYMYSSSSVRPISLQQIGKKR